MKKFGVVMVGAILVMLLSGCRCCINRGERVDGKSNEWMSFSRWRVFKVYLCSCRRDFGL